MIVWGGWNGSNSFNTGGRYNPGTDGWTAISTTNAPAARYDHTAVWTSNEMIVWEEGMPAIISILAANTIQAQTVGQPPARPTRPEAGLVTPQCGPAVT